MATTAILTYKARISYEIEIIENAYKMVNLQLRMNIYLQLKIKKNHLQMKYHQVFCQLFQILYQKR